MNSEAACRAYLEEVRRIRGTGHGTMEQSYYTALNNLLDSLLASQKPARRAMGHPAGIEGDFPDVALYEVSANVLVLPVEVKPAPTGIATLGKSSQARRYATSFGGGQVVVTNLWQFAVARLVGTKMVVDPPVSLVGSEADLDLPASSLGDAPDELSNLLSEACAVRGAIRKPSAVASFLAFHARHMRDSIEATGEPGVLLSSISRALKDGLGIEVPEKLLVATVVQTLIYGLFAAWLDDEHPHEFDWMDSSYRLQVPVFADVLHAALRPAVIRRCNLKHHLDAVARVLMWVDRDRFAKRFDGGAIEYFYEPFLALFDEKLRDQLGVWYTPREIAEYQVARADHALRTELGVTGGITDEVVYLLDPGCGTGTYIAAALRFIYEKHVANGEPTEVALARTVDAATSRVIGFEVLPAAFVVAHLHIGRFLAQLGADPLEERLRIYLTNALTGWPPHSPPVGLTLFPELEDELRDASHVKHHEPVLVILGNPPYQGYSSAESDEEKEMLKPWTEPLWPVWHLRKHRMNDLYVRFWRMSIEKVARLTGRGVVSFITNRKWLGGRSYPTMREAVITNFDDVVVDDLHGAVDDRSHPGDQSIFTTAVAAGITRGTAIVTATRTDSEKHAGATVRIRDLWGGAAAKRGQLVSYATGAIDSGLVNVATDQDRWWKFTADAGGDFPAVDEYLSVVHSGVQPVRDEAVLSFTKASLVKRIGDYFDKSLGLDEILSRYPAFGVRRSGYDPADTRARLLSSGQLVVKERFVNFLYRPFDVRWMYWHPEHRLLHRPRPEQMSYWIRMPSQRALVLPQTRRREGAARPVVTSCVAAFAAAEPDARLLPLYEPAPLHGVEGGYHAADEATPLVTAEWIAAARSAGVAGTDNELAETIFYALVAIMNSPDWIADQPVDADDFPEVPLPGDAKGLSDAARIGRQIAALNDPLVDVPTLTSGAIDGKFASIGVPDTASGAQTLEFGKFGERGGERDGTDVLWAPGKGWRNVPDEIWSFTACGHFILTKWLSYRVGTGMTSSDRQAFMLLCRRLAAIRALEPECNSSYAAARVAPLTL